MNVFVVLSVLVWSGLTRAETPCTSGVCGCCLISQQLSRTEAFFEKMYECMSGNLTLIKNTLNEIRGQRYVFSAHLTSTQDRSISAAGTIDYNEVNENEGEHYNGGKFVAPVKGVYNFHVSLFNRGDERACAYLLVNEQRVYSLEENSETDRLDSSSISTLQALEAGDEVWVDQPDNCHLYAFDNHHFNSFTGYLLYTTA